MVRRSIPGLDGGPLDSESPVSRRRLLALLGAGGVALVGTACNGNTSEPGVIPRHRNRATTSAPDSPSTTAASSTSCILTPEQTEGPYYLAGEPERSDITEGRPGIPLRLALSVVSVPGCAAIRNATVDVWHADAGGVYSGFGSATSSRTFLRGVQRTGVDGKVAFETIYPGWYQGRATHIHVKVFVGASTVHTGQLYFDEQVTSAVYATAPYSSHTGQRTTNDQDSIFASGGPQSMLTLTRDGTGYVGTLTLGIRIGGGGASPL